MSVQAALFRWRLIAISALLLLAAGVYVFFIQGDTRPSPDGRTSIQLSNADRNLVLAEMRQFLVSVQGISEALTREDMATVTETARAVGNAAVQAVPPSLMASLPLEFKTMGRGVHRAFDQLAMDAESLAEPRHSLQQMSDILSQCVACHAAYRLDER